MLLVGGGGHVGRASGFGADTLASLPARTVCSITSGPDCDFFTRGPYVLIGMKAFLLNVYTSKVKIVAGGRGVTQPVFSSSTT